MRWKERVLSVSYAWVENQGGVQAPSPIAKSTVKDEHLTYIYLSSLKEKRKLFHNSFLQLVLTVQLGTQSSIQTCFDY